MRSFSSKARLWALERYRMAKSDQDSLSRILLHHHLLDNLCRLFLFTVGHNQVDLAPLAAGGPERLVGAHRVVSDDTVGGIQD